MNLPAVGGKPRSPIRALYDTLLRLDSAENIDYNLDKAEVGYAEMRGDREPRFCEWAYDQIEKRTLVKSLLGGVLRPTDALKLAREAGCDMERLQHLDPRIVLAEALETLGVRVPRLPSPIFDGLAELEACFQSLDGALSAATTDAQSVFESAAGLGRRGGERLLKVLCFFLWDTGHAGTIQEIVMHQRFGYQREGRFQVPDNPQGWERWLHSRSLGQYNFLLRAISTAIRAGSLPHVPFLGASRQVWPEAVFSTFCSFASALVPAVHDKQTAERVEVSPRTRLEALYTAVGKIIGKESQEGWRPCAIQFFRKVSDGHSVHHEGYDTRGKVVRFLETRDEYELHVPYVFVSATNPAAVEYSCARLRPEFERGV